MITVQDPYSDKKELKTKVKEKRKKSGVVVDKGKKSGAVVEKRKKISGAVEEKEKQRRSFGVISEKLSCHEYELADNLLKMCKSCQTLASNYRRT